MDDETANELLRRLLEVAAHDALAARIVLQRILPGLLTVVRVEQFRGHGVDAFDVLLAEASWTHDPPNRPPGIHLSGTEAGRIAAEAGVAELLLTHIPPWTSREDVIAEAKAEFSGPVHAVSPGEAFDF